MKKVLLAAVLGFCSCAPQIQQEAGFTSRAAYTASCSDVLNQLTDTALRTRPAVAFGGNGWQLFQPVDRTDSSVAFRSTTGQGAVAFAVNVRGQCVQDGAVARLALTSSGQQENLLRPLHDALLSGVILPRT